MANWTWEYNRYSQKVWKVTVPETERDENEFDLTFDEIIELMNEYTNDNE